MPKQKIQIMGKDLFRNLPSEIKLEILSRLPIRSAIKCKLVDRSWRSMIESPEFAKSYKSSPCLAVSESVRELLYSYKVYEVEDGDGNSENSCKEAFNFSFPHDDVQLHTSVNGLMFMSGHYLRVLNMYICNPVTREYITIPTPENVDWRNYGSYGFGVSRKSGQFKVVKIFDKFVSEGFRVYTVGTGLWRSIAIAPSSSSLSYQYYKMGAFLNGNFHWLAYDKLDDSPWISCFDLETEVLTTLRAPCRYVWSRLRVVRNSLCICDFSSEDKTVIWLMKDYGDDRSWTMQFVLPKMHRDLTCLIHVFKDGDILFKDYGKRTSCYSNKTKAIQETHLINLHEEGYPKPLSYSPSFLPLKTFSSTENVSSF